MSSAICRACGERFSPRSFTQRYCDPCNSDVVYRFIAPDGRSYVGSTWCSGLRQPTLSRSNSRIKTASEKYPPETWSFELLERVPVGQSRFEAEQRHIDRLGTLNPDRGFNMRCAWPFQTFVTP
jgi:hypothetical protein